jgi:signal peptidase II
MAVILLDQVSKYLALEHLIFKVPVKITSFFNLYLDHNFGAAFSFLAGAAGWQLWFFSGIAVVVSVWIIAYFLRHTHISRCWGWGLSFILGGALGNFIDRLIHGYVIDFISWHINNYYWPTFNIADSAVFVGVIFLLCEMKK